MTGERGGPTVRVDQLNANTGGVGVQVRVDGRGLQRRSTVPSTQGEPKFTGRDAELVAIADELTARHLVVVHGAPGLGKSRLVREYAHRHAASYPGGMFWVPFDQPPPIELAKLLRDTDRPAYADESLDDQCRRALRDLGSAGRVLVTYDAISGEQVLRDWLPYDGLDWHLIVTSTSAIWASAWRTVEIEALHPEAGHQLVASILDEEAAAARLAVPIAAKAGGVTIELCASAAAARERLRRGRSIERISADLATGTASSFESAWRLLSADGQLVLQVASTFVTPRVPASLVVSALQRIGWEESRVEDAIDNAQDRRLAGGDHESIDVHQLVARFARARGPVDPLVRRALLDGLVDTARGFGAHPADVQRRAQLLAHSLDIDDWAELAGADFPWHMMGSAIDELSKFAEALPWYERAVAVKEKGDLDGRVDSQSLGTSLHQVGSCYSRQGKYAEALPWFERAVAAQEKGDLDGRVDSQSLGASLHQVGSCYSRQGKYAEALPWFERAVAAQEQGDVHGRVDSQSLGKSLHQVGYYNARQGKYAEALPWFERAVAAQEKGNLDGRVDSQSLGVSLFEVGSCYASQDKYAEALPWYECAVAAQEKGDVHGRVDSQSLGRSLHQVGSCYASQGKYAETLPWLERAVAAQEKGDVHGRLDSQSLGVSLDLVGSCYSRQGKYAEALPWLERAVAAQEKGDVHGRVDSQSLGTSLHQMGSCYASQGKFAEALPWYERAVAAQEKGDVHGRVDSRSLGKSLHQVGYCYASQGKFAEALPWYERAVAAQEKGDVHGRVDSQSLGKSLHQVGLCHTRLGNIEDARMWSERASRVKRSGEL